MSGTIRASWFETREDALLTMRETGALRRQTDSPVVPICRIPTGLISTPNQKHLPALSRLTKRGVSRSSRTLGAGCGGRFGGARRAARKRTAKSCGPGIPTLMSSLRGDDLAGDGGKKARSPGSSKETVKTIAQGMPGGSGVTAVTNSYAIFILHARLRALSSARHSLCPLFSLRDSFRTARARLRCGRVESCLDKTSLRAERSNPYLRGRDMDCFVAPRNDGEGSCLKFKISEPCRVGKGALAPCPPAASLFV